MSPILPLAAGSLWLCGISYCILVEENAFDAFLLLLANRDAWCGNSV